jgi:hypothetical protein
MRHGCAADFKCVNRKYRVLALWAGARISMLFASERNSKMTKTSSLALVAAALVAAVGFSLPVMADENDPMTPDNEASVLSTLQSQGIVASDLQEWNGKIRATVTLADGSTTFQYFDADTLQPLGDDNLTTGSIGGSYQRNVERDAAPQSLNSLTAVNQDDLE